MTRTRSYRTHAPAHPKMRTYEVFVTGLGFMGRRKIIARARCHPAIQSRTEGRGVVLTLSALSRDNACAIVRQCIQSVAIVQSVREVS